MELTALEDQQNTTADSPEESKNAPQETETLGVLLVHGIGSQQRGDTLVQCTTALHSWIRDWLRNGDPENRLNVDLVDVSIAEAGPDHPAQARIVFRRGNDTNELSWLIAESCWFETYRRAGFYEFLSWALWVLPVSVIVHFVPALLRFGRAHSALDAAKSGSLTPRQFFDLKHALGSVAAEMVAQEVAKKGHLIKESDLLPYRAKIAGLGIGIHIKLTLATIVAIVVQLMITLVAFLAIVPGFTRNFAGWVQRKLSATLGDSFLFVTSPITGAAVTTRVKKDLEWLMARCDRVIVLAHSQGAAVSYKVIKRQFWGGHAHERLHALITYGSGLQKLFDLEVNVARALGYWMRPAVRSIALAVPMSILIVLFLSGIIPWWIALPSVVAGVWFQKSSWPKKAIDHPQILPLPWHDFYSSHDPVPNGPIDVWTDEALTSDVAEFYSRQCEVVNRRSILDDHTSYWSSPDDFVAGVADILANASNMPIHSALDKEWLKISTNRRLWRVSWLSRCRVVAGLTSLSILFWPRPMLEAAAIPVRELMGAVAANLPEKLAAWAPSAALVPDWLLGAGGLVLTTYLMFLVALASSALWEKQELTRFFKREPHPSIGVAGWIFALGWLGVLISAPSYVLAHVHWDWRDVLAVSWAPLILAVWSGWMAHKSGHGPGTPLEWGRIALAHAEKAFADKERDREESLRDALGGFLRSRKYLEMKHSGGDEWVRAVIGETRAIEEGVKDFPLATYQLAIEALERAGRDASELQTRLDKALHEQSLSSKPDTAAVQANG
jgi:hypothetical protein